MRFFVPTVGKYVQILTRSCMAVEPPCQPHTPNVPLTTSSSSPSVFKTLSATRRISTASIFLSVDILFLLDILGMARLLSPVCTEALRFKNFPISTSICRVFSGTIGCWNQPCLGLRTRGFPRVVVMASTAGASSTSSDAAAEDYYAVLGLLPDATPAQIKKAYYNCMKACHPDLSGNDPETTNFCMFVNEVYTVLSDPLQRMIYDEIHGYTLTAVNPFLDDSYPKDHVFVDEFCCIGCKNCANVASDVFAIEEEYGRARAYSQCGKPDSVQQAIDSCPVDCIHWISAAQLSLLEDEMLRVERVNVAFMLSGMGSGGVDVFRMASSRWEKRQAKVLGQAKIRMMKQKGSDKTNIFWNNLWGRSKEYRNSEEEAKARARRAAAAAAAQRWREYSRRGVDKPPTLKLPEK